MSDPRLHTTARQLAGYLEPIVGSVYFAPECHERYAALGFAPSPGKAGGVQLPDGPAYFTSRGSCLGQVPGELVASAFAVFNPAAVVPSVSYGWTLTDAKTIATARTEGAVAQLERILGPEPEGLDRATEILRRATDPAAARRVDRCTRACSASASPAHRWATSGASATTCASSAATRTPQLGWRSGSTRPRSACSPSSSSACRCAPTSARVRGATTSLMRRSSDCRSRDLVDADGTGFTDGGRELRESIEISTDLSMAPTIEAIGDDADELFALLGPWGQKMREAGGYLSGGACRPRRASERDPGSKLFA